MNKLAQFFSFILFSFLTFFGQTFISSAQEGEEIMMNDTRYAAVSVSHAAALDFVDKSGFNVSLTVKNIFPEKRAYQVGIEFRGIDDNNKGEFFVWRNPEEFHIEGSLEQPLSFVVSNPVHLAGKYQLTLGINDRRGNIVAMVSLGEKEFSHAGRVNLKNCAFSGAGGVIYLPKPTESLGTCEVIWDGAEDGLVRIMTQVVSARYGVPKIVGESRTIMKSETTALGSVVISEPVEPGMYHLEIVPVATGGYPIGVPIKKTLVVPGKGGKLKGVERFEPGKSFASGEVVPALVQFDLYDAGKYDILLELMSQGVSCATPIRASIDGQPNLYEGEFTIKNDCSMPEIRATLLSDGKQIDQLANGNNDMPMGTDTKGQMMKSEMLRWLLVGGAGISALILGYFFMKRRSRARRMMVPMLFLLFAASMFFGFGAKQAEAGSTSLTLNYVCAGSCPAATDVYFSPIATDKDVYSPGETISVQVFVQGDDSPQGGCPVFYMGINGGIGSDLIPGCYATNQLTSGLFFNFAISAPVASGPFNLTVAAGLNGYGGQSANIPLAVSGTPPTVALSAFSPSTITEGQSAVISLSTTNATSCSGDAGSIWTGNLGGTNFFNISTGPMSAGTYTQRVTCTGPGGSASSATQVLTVNAAPSASGNFTSTPPCTIVAGDASCQGLVGWTSSNTSTVVLTNCGGTALATRGTGMQLAVGPVYVPYNSGCYQIRNGSASGPILDQAMISSSCASGTSWDGSKCAPAGTVASFTSGPACVIATNQSGCNTTLSWTASNVSTIILTNCMSDSMATNDVALTTITNSGPGSFNPVYVPYNSGCYRLHNGSVTGTILDQIRVSSSCVSGTAHDGVIDSYGNISLGFCVPIATGAPTVQITATGPVAFETQTWWQKVFSWITGKGSVVHATGSPASIVVGQNARIDWSSSGATLGCTVEKVGGGFTSFDPSGSQTLTGLSAGTHAYSIQCSNASGTSTDSVQVFVSSGSGGGAICGNGIREGSEACDNGGSNGTCPANCSNLCTLNSCGPINGVCAPTHNNCLAGISDSPTSDSTMWYWYCNGSGAGATNAWCNESKAACTPSYTNTTASCESVAGVFGSGVPADQTYGTANYTINSCSGARVYTGGCSVPPTCSPTANTYTQSCSSAAGSYGIPATHTVGTANFYIDTCWAMHYTGGCSAPSCTNIIGTFTIACSAAAGELGIPLNYTVGTATIGVTACGTTSYLGGCSLPPGSPQYTIHAMSSSNGTISPAGYIRNIPQGSSRTFVITPDAGYVIASVAIDGVNQGSLNSVTINNIQSNHTIQPFFAAAPAGPSGQITAMTPCTIPLGGSTCTSQISWTTSNTIPVVHNPTLQVVGGSPTAISGTSGTNQSFTMSEGPHVINLYDVSTGTVYDTDTLVATCVTGAVWTGGSCQAGPTVNLTVNGSAGPVAAAPGDALTIDWTVSDATSCTASGKWSGSKSIAGGTENVSANVPSGDYILTCVNAAGITVSRQVTVNLACAVNTTTWSACGPPCSGGDGTRSRTVTTAACVVTTEVESCTTNTCRDLNWKEVGQ